MTNATASAANHDYEMHGRELAGRLLIDPIVWLWIAAMVMAVFLFLPTQTQAWLMLLVMGVVVGLRAKAINTKRQRLHQAVTSSDNVAVDVTGAVDLRDSASQPATKI